MNGKDVAFADHARAQLLKGIDVLANAVSNHVRRRLTAWTSPMR